MASFPASQIAGHDWILNVLDDLIGFAGFSELVLTERALKQARWQAMSELRSRLRGDPAGEGTATDRP